MHWKEVSKNFQSIAMERSIVKGATTLKWIGLVGTFGKRFLQYPMCNNKKGYPKISKKVSKVLQWKEISKSIKIDIQKSIQNIAMERHMMKGATTLCQAGLVGTFGRELIKYSRNCNGKNQPKVSKKVSKVLQWKEILRKVQPNCGELVWSALHWKIVSKSTQGIAMERSIQKYQHERIQSISKERTGNHIVADWSGRHSWEIVCTKSKKYCKAKKH